MIRNIDPGIRLAISMVALIASLGYFSDGVYAYFFSLHENSKSIAFYLYSVGATHVLAGVYIWPKNKEITANPRNLLNIDTSTVYLLSSLYAIIRYFPSIAAAILSGLFIAPEHKSIPVNFSQIMDALFEPISGRILGIILLIMYAQNRRQ